MVEILVFMSCMSFFWLHIFCGLAVELNKNRLLIKSQYIDNMCGSKICMHHISMLTKSYVEKVHASHCMVVRDLVKRVINASGTAIPIVK